MDTSHPNSERPRSYCIVINSDASCSSRRRIGAYAYYIRADGLKLKNYGILRTRTRSINVCELLAVGNALAHLLQQPTLPIVQKIIINTDSQATIQRIERGVRRERKPIFAAVVPRILALLATLRERTSAQEVELRHVRAHANTDDAKTRANHWCDHHARVALRAAVREHSQTKKAEK